MAPSTIESALSVFAFTYRRHAFALPFILHALIRSLSRPHSGVFVLSAMLLLSLVACSPQAADAAPSGSNSTVIIVRESKPEFPDKAIARHRELQQRCIDGRMEVAKAQGWAYDPASDAITDADILALETEKSEEYFDGQKYAVIVTGTQIAGTSFGPTQEANCKLTSMPFKSVDIRDGDCRRLSVKYDLPQPSGRRTEIKGACDKESVENIDQSGETATVAANQQCRWSKDDGNPLHVATCTLPPNAVHAGTGLPLVAIRYSLFARTLAACAAPTNRWQAQKR